MKLSAWIFTAPIVAAFAVACGSSSPAPKNPTQAPASSSAETMPHGLAPGQLKLAHFASPDGMLGFVLDRTGSKPKIRVDGDKDIYELTPREDRFSGELRGYFFDKPDGHAIIYLSTSGTIKFFKGRDEFRVSSDKAAEPLGPPTVSGEPKHEKAAHEVFCDSLSEISVRKKFPQFKAEDSSNLAKVSEAIGMVDATVFVHYVERDPNGWIPRQPSWTPSNISGIAYGGGSRQSDLAWEPEKAKGLAKFGGMLKGYSEYESQGNHIFLQSLKGYPKPLANNTPGIVWEVDGSTVVLVSLDGARYQVDASSVEKGAPIERGTGPENQWPAVLQHSLVGIEEISALAKAAAVPQSLVEELSAQDDEWNKCAQKTWKGAKPEFTKLHITDMRYDTRNAQVRQLVEKWEEKVRKACKAPVEKQEKSLLTFIEERNKQRLAIFEKAKAKAAGK